MSRPGVLHPQIQALAGGRPAARFSDGPAAVAELRAGYAATADLLGGEPAGVARCFDVVAAGVPCRAYEPLQPAVAAGLVIYAHGGGWVIGDLDGVDRICRRLAAASGCRVLSIDYRLAPEHLFPAPLDDVRTIVRWAASEEGASALGHDAGRLGVAGDSAGGNLVAAAALLEPGLVRAQFLIYPALDATLSSRCYAAPTEGDEFLSRDDMSAAYSMYLGDTDPADPRVSVLLAQDLSAAPASLVVAAQADVLRDDAVRFAAALADAGVPVTLDVAEGMVHGFARWGGAVDAANVRLDAGGRFLGEALTK